jgi:ABC-type methionine transport system permease subunit
MADMVDTIIGVLVWEFVTAIMLMTSNTIVSGYVVPLMHGITTGYVLADGTTYAQLAAPIENAFVIALYIFAAIPFIYLLVRLLIKREQTAPPAPYYGQGGVY